MDTNAKRAKDPPEFVITQEMIDIARESISFDEDDVPTQPARKQLHRLNVICTLILLIIGLIFGLDRGASSHCL